MMKLIVGLGNPGDKYKKTRHNIGFVLLDEMAKAQDSSWENKDKFKAVTAELEIAGEKIILCKPQTFMNNSGEAVQALKNYYKLESKDILVIHDEVDIEFGKSKLSQNSGSAGHNGVQSVIDLVSKNITRLRIGIDSREDKSTSPTEKYVLDQFTSDEQTLLDKDILPQSLQLVHEWLK